MSYDLIMVQQCCSVDGWVPIKVSSSSNPYKHYIVLCNPWGAVEEYICQCEGYNYRNYCRHQKEAHEMRCGWISVIDRQWTETQQTEQQKLDKICPECGGPTTWTMEVVEVDA